MLVLIRWGMYRRTIIDRSVAPEHVENMPRQPFRRIDSVHDCVREEMDLEARCLACDHTAIFEPEELRQLLIHKRIWSDLKDIERALSCAKCRERRCRLTLVDRVVLTRLDWDRGERF
jgi:hypothetical protein